MNGTEGLGAGTFNAAKTGGTGPHRLAGRSRRGDWRNAAAIGDLAQDGRSLASPVAGCGGNGRRGGASARRAPLRCAATFTPEVTCQIMALACTDPETLDVPISHWSHSELARQSVARGIVKSISHGSVGRFLKKRPISNRIATVTGWPPSLIATSTRSAPISVRFIRRPRRRRTRRADRFDRRDDRYPGARTCRPEPADEAWTR
jgi:hypothetical protein